MKQFEKTPVITVPKVDLSGYLSSYVLIRHMYLHAEIAFLVQSPHNQEYDSCLGLALHVCSVPFREWIRTLVAAFSIHESRLSLDHRQDQHDGKGFDGWLIVQHSKCLRCDGKDHACPCSGTYPEPGEERCTFLGHEIDSSRLYSSWNFFSVIAASQPCHEKGFSAIQGAAILLLLLILVHLLLLAIYSLGVASAVGAIPPSSPQSGAELASS